MKNRSLLVLLVIALMLSLVAFAACKAEEAPPVVEEEEEVWQWPEKLYIVTQGVGVADYGAGVAWSTPLAEDTGMTVRLVAEDSVTQHYKWLAEGRVHLAGLSESYTQLEGLKEYATRDLGPFQARVVYSKTKNYFGYSVRADSGIYTPHDIKPGMKIIYMSFSPIGYECMLPLLAWAGLEEDDVTFVPAGSVAAMGQFLIEGKGDVSFGAPVSPAWYDVEAAPHGQRWIELDWESEPEEAARAMAAGPTGYLVHGVAEGSLVPSAIGVKMFAILAGYITRSETDPELVYNLAKWLHENWDRYKDAHPYGAMMTIDDLMVLAEQHYMPLHDGTVRYLRELGLWTEAHETRRQQNIDIMTRWVEAFQTATDMADQQGIEVDSDSEKWIELWENYKKELNIPRVRLFPGLD